MNMNYRTGSNWTGFQPGRALNNGGFSSGSSMVSSFQQQQQPQQQHQQPLSHANKIGLYTRYYHEWKAIADSSASTKSEKEWATYYADLASRAAHFFHQNPYSTTAPPHDLPPAPPGSDASNPSTAMSSQQNVQQVNTVQSQVNSGPDPKSFHVYVDRCLQQCETQQQKDQMIADTKLVLQNAIKEGQLHKKDWSMEPLISSCVGENKNTAPPPSISSFTGEISTVPPKLNPLNKSPKKKQSSKKNSKALVSSKRTYLQSSSSSVNDSYYGPSAASSTSSFSPAGSPKRKKSLDATSGFNSSSDTLTRRAKRFATSLQQNSFESFEEGSQGDVIVGTCRVLEKEYLRLTSAPKPELVRPQPILEEHFRNLQSEYADLKRRRDYLWFCSQLKAIRQDCTVQHLKNEFCVFVYEYHAKVALENGGKISSYL